jgi:CubicO group peptidase (beta-lactamase class C family)
MKNLAMAAALLCGLLGPPTGARAAAPDRQAAVEDVDAFIHRAMAQVGAVPGLSIAVIEGDKVLMTAGYGLADMRSRKPVDADTYFYIASSTKSFTALGLAARTAREGVSLDTPLALLFPRSGLPTDIAGSVTLTDLLSHRSGVENEPLTFRAAYSGEVEPETMRALVADARWSRDTPHGVFDYSNLGYNLATTLMDDDWRTLVRDEVLAPAGLVHTTASVAEAMEAGVVAVGHFGDSVGAPRVSPLQKVDATMHSAGGLVSTANDMARWLELQLNDGRIDGDQVFPVGLVASTHRALVVQDRRFGAYHRDGYGLGWNLGLYRGERLIHHFGNFSGSRAHVSFMPDRKVGVAVMVNEDLVAGELADVVADYVYDRLAGRPDLAEAAEQEIETLAARRDQRRAALERARAERSARPWILSRPRSSLVGDYHNPEMGTLHVRETPEGVEVSIGLLKAVAEPFTETDSLRVELVPFQGQVIHFLDADRLAFDGMEFLRR